MSGFVFSLVENTHLVQHSGGYFLFSEVPLRVLRLNSALFAALEPLTAGGEISLPSGSPPQLLRSMLTLVSRGYLRLVSPAELRGYPRVSVIIPVRDQPEELAGCLGSLAGLDYPHDNLEVIVVDDGSKEPLTGLTSPLGLKLLRLGKSLGPAAARNTGVAGSGGDILAFIDADCTASGGWLRELVPFFELEGIGAVGGFVASLYRRSYLDRYEAAFSSLNMGPRVIYQPVRSSSFYVPSCNLLVRRGVFLATGGFKGDMHVGEDVDFCWRMRDLGHDLLYVPFGRVAHKHPNHLGKMLERRWFYGTSEAPLYRAHRVKKKLFPIPIYAGLSFLALVAAVLLFSPYPLLALPPLLGADFWQKSHVLWRLKMPLALKKRLSSVLRGHFSFYYLAFFHLLRYYFILLVGLGFLWHPVWLLGGLALIMVSLVDYLVKKPGLPYPVFLYYYTLEHLAYQVGVFWGCLKRGYFGAYIPAFSVRDASPKSLL